MILHPATVKTINAVAMPVLGFALICAACALAYFALGWWQNRRHDQDDNDIWEP